MSKKYKLDEIDKKIINTFQTNGRISNIDLSSIVGVSPSPCLRRVKALEEKGFIKGFYANLDYEKFNYKLIIYASLVSKASNAKERAVFEGVLNKIDNILEVYMLQNDVDYLVKIVVKDELDYQQLINDKLGKIPFISKIRTTRISKVIKYTNKITI